MDTSGNTHRTYLDTAEDEQTWKRQTARESSFPPPSFPLRLFLAVVSLVAVHLAVVVVPWAFHLHQKPWPHVPLLAWLVVPLSRALAFSEESQDSLAFSFLSVAVLT